MTALRELAERWKDANRGETLYVEGKTSGMHACAAELLAILDAEGDGVAVACGYLITWNDPTHRGRQTLSFDKCSPDDGSFEPVYTHPARSGVVRDEDVRWLLTQLGHNEFNHDYIKDARLCDVCNRIKSIAAKLDAAIQGKRHER